MKKTIGIIMCIISILWVFHTFSKNFMVDPAFEKFLARKDQLLTDTSLWLFMIRIHILLAILSLLTGPFGLLKRVRAQSIKFHRWNGRVYVLSILFNFIPGVFVSFFATGGWPSTIGFLILNTLWLGTTILGYLSIKKQRIILHRQWMIRSFFLSFANMTIYIIVAITHNVMNVSYGSSYTIAVWLCWALNLLAAEWISRYRVIL